MSERLSVTFGVHGFEAASDTHVGRGFVSTDSTGAAFMPVGVRWNPFKGEHRLQSLKPYVTVAAGPVIGAQSANFVGNGSVTTDNSTRATFGTHFGGGFDVHVARSFSLGLDVGYNAMVNFSRTARRPQESQRPANVAGHRLVVRQGLHHTVEHNKESTCLVRSSRRWSSCVFSVLAETLRAQHVSAGGQSRRDRRPHAGYHGRHRSAG
jgi:hypothetical protein